MKRMPYGLKVYLLLCRLISGQLESSSSRWFLAKCPIGQQMPTKCTRKSNPRRYWKEKHSRSTTTLLRHRWPGSWKMLWLLTRLRDLAGKNLFLILFSSRIKKKIDLATNSVSVWILWLQLRWRNMRMRSHQLLRTCLSSFRSLMWTIILRNLSGWPKPRPTSKWSNLRLPMMPYSNGHKQLTYNAWRPNSFTTKSLKR